jgi:hypothetical protein
LLRLKSADEAEEDGESKNFCKEMKRGTGNMGIHSISYQKK